MMTWEHFYLFTTQQTHSRIDEKHYETGLVVPICRLPMVTSRMAGMCRTQAYWQELGCKKKKKKSGGEGGFERFGQIFCCDDCSHGGRPTVYPYCFYVLSFREGHF